jgi:diadenosine tetraphosphate (Ap4A) HIT family hydrolase
MRRTFAVRNVERVFTPCQVNYLLLGNIVPHLHVHIDPRRPGRR